MRVEAKKHGQIFNYFINQGVQIMTKDMTMGSPLGSLTVEYQEKYLQVL